MLTNTLKFEVFDRVGDVKRSPVDLRLRERPVKQLPRWPNEHTALLLLYITRLLTDQHDAGIGRAFAKNGRRPVATDWTPGAALGFRCQSGQ